MELSNILKEGYLLNEIQKQGDCYWFKFIKKGWVDCNIKLKEVEF